MCAAHPTGVVEMREGAFDPVCGELLISPESAIRHTQLERPFLRPSNNGSFAEPNNQLSPGCSRIGTGSSNSLCSATQSSIFALSAENSKIVRTFARFPRAQGTGEAQILHAGGRSADGGRDGRGEGVGRTVSAARRDP